ncbi:Uncharacterised protein [Mycobacterium tuberculosis]|nr:Uncharacterised protein [Mycobacterium tuberculosis]
MQKPARLRVSSGKYRHTTGIRIPASVDYHLHRNGAGGGQQQGCGQRQLVKHRVADFVAGADRQLHESGAREQHHV